MVEGLPPPVQRYLRAALPEGQPQIVAADLEHAGTFNLREDGENWKRFTSTQRVVTRPPGFDWNARIALLPGLAIRVRDAYERGEGLLRAKLLGFTVAEAHGTRSLAEGELMRYLAEAVWYPTALLPGQGVRWEPLDERSASATLQDGDVSATLQFRFGPDGLIESLRSEARGRMVRGTAVPTPWEGRWWGYAGRGGMQVPLEGEVAWILPSGARPYWRGRLTRIAYEFAR